MVYDGEGPYAVRVAEVQTPCPDSDHGDTCEIATALLVDDEPVGGCIDPDSDEDWFSFTVQAGHAYEVALDWSAGLNPLWEIYGSDCSTLIQSGR